MIKPVAVQGLKEFQRALRKLDADAPKGLRLAMNKAVDHLIGMTRPKIPRRTGNAAASLKAKSTRTEARVGIGGKKAPYYPWLDFGGKTGPGRSVDRPFYKDGRYLYPTLAEERPEVQRILEAEIVAVAEGAGLDVT